MAKPKTSEQEFFKPKVFSYNFETDLNFVRFKFPQKTYIQAHNNFFRALSDVKREC